MSRLDHLPPDQHAALSLLLRQGKSYAEVAALLAIPERAVHDRAHAALAVLAPRQARELTPERREQVGDYLLGQRAGVAERLAARTYLEGAPAAQAWAKAIAAELERLAAAPLPEIPDGAGARAQAPGRALEPSPPRASRAGRPGEPTGSTLPGSRLGGALLLGAIVVGVIVAVILISGSGGGSSSHRTTSSASATGSSSASTTPTSTAARATEDRRITLLPPDPASKAIGVAEVLSEGSKYAFYLAAEHLQPSKGFFYAVWLYNSPSSHEALGKSPPVGSNGRLQGGALLPTDAGNYHKMLLTRETSSQPTQPGPIVLSGTFALH
jgi:Sigma-70, region 4